MRTELTGGSFIFASPPVLSSQTKPPRGEVFFMPVGVYERTLVPLHKRFWKRVKKTKTCWLWTAGTSNGYGSTSVMYKHYRAHRVSWEYANGRKLLPGENLLHSCNNKRCVNPRHLSIGGQSQNAIDWVRTGGCNFMKLSENDVREIRHLGEAGVSRKEISQRFSVTESHVNNLIMRRSRAYVL